MLYFLLAAVLAALPGTPASTELAQVFAAGTAIGATMAISPIRASSTCSTSGRAGACRRPISRWRGKTTIYVTWRDKRGEQADVVPINFDPTAALAEEQKKLLEQFWTSWIAFREWQGMTVYFTHVVTYPAPSKRWATASATARSTRCSIPPCDDADPHSVPENATLYMKVPPKTASMQVQLTDVDGTTSPARSFNAPI